MIITFLFHQVKSLLKSQWIISLWRGVEHRTNSDARYPASYINPVTSFSRQKPLKSKNKKTYVCLEYKDLLSSKLWTERIKAAKVVPRRVLSQASFAPTVYGLRTGLIRSTNMFFGLSFILKSASVNFELCLKYLIRRPLHVKFLVGKYV